MYIPLYFEQWQKQNNLIFVLIVTILLLNGWGDAPNVMNGTRLLFR